MAALGTLPEPNFSRKSPIGKSGVLTLSGFGIKVRMQCGHLEIEDGIGPERRRIRLARVAHGLKRLVVIGSDGFVTLESLRWLADQKASFLMLERDGSVLATTGPVSSSDAKLRRAQALAHVSGAALRITRELIRQKLTGQELVARNKLLDSTTADRIAKFACELPKADNAASVRLIEAQAASAYWSAWRTLPINFPKNDLARIPSHWLSFGARISPLTGSPRLSINPPNAMLNYLYALLESEARLAAASLGLDPGLGVLHVDSGNRDSLALDLLEPARTQVDAYVLDWITRQSLSREWFSEQRNGNCRLVGSFATRLSETAPMWGRAVAPIAEWVAQAFWNSHQRSDSPVELLPTRLTHRRRREGRGNVFEVHGMPTPPRIKICEVCGVEGVKGRYCRVCAVEVSRETMAQVALLGHAKPKSNKSKTRVSKKLSDHAVANSWWDPSSLPTWLTGECYVNRIQPRLRAKKVREIATGIRVSKPYAALVRSGQRRPHPRHWLALASLVNVSADSE
jgi:CRISPR-associated endonuclease Cas1